MAVKRIGPARQYKRKGGWSRNNPKTPEQAGPSPTPSKQIVEAIPGISINGIIEDRQISIPVSIDQSAGVVREHITIPGPDILDSSRNIQPSVQEYIEYVTGQNPIIQSDVQPSSASHIERILEPTIIPDSNIPQSAAGYIEHIHTASPVPPLEIPQSSQEYIEVRNEQSPLVSTDIPQSAGIYVERDSPGAAIIPGDITPSQTNYIERLELPAPVISPDIPQSAQTYREDIIPVLPDIPNDIRSVAEQTVIERISPISPSITPSPDQIFIADESEKLLRKEFRFGNGRWIPDAPGISLGNDNYQTLKNFRYSNTGLDGVDGFTRINTNATGKYLKTGIQLRTPHSQESYILAQGEDSDGTDRILIKNTADIPSTGDFSGIQIKYAAGNLYFYTRLDGDPATETPIIPIAITPSGTGYTATGLAEELERRLNLSAILRQGLEDDPFIVAFSSNTFTITCTGGVSISYVHSGSSAATYFGFTADIALGTSISGPEVTDFYTPFYPEDSSALAGRMAILPRGNVGFCDGVVNRIWAGDEMPVGACFVIDRISASSPTIQSIREEFCRNVTDRVNNSNTDSENVVAIDTISKGFGATTTQIDVTAVAASSTETPSWKYAWDGNGTAPGFVTNGLEIGHVMVVSASAPFADANTGALKVVATGTDYFTVENKDGAEDLNVVLGAANRLSVYGKMILVGCPRRATAFNLDFTVYNSTVGVLDVAGWSGTAFVDMDATDGTRDTATLTKTCAKDGQVVLDTSLVDVVPAYIDGEYLYWYLFTFGDMVATIKQITAQCDIQNISNIWDGVWRTAILCRYFDDSADVMKNYTLETSKESYTSLSAVTAYEGGAYVISIPSAQEDLDFLDIMFEEPTCALKIKMMTGNTVDDTIVKVFYNDGNIWQIASVIQDTTVIGYKAWLDPMECTLNKSGVIQWNKPSNENKITLDGVTGYAYRIRFYSATQSVVTSASTSIDTIHGLPSYQIFTKLYTFPHQHRNRAMWCGCISDNEQHRVDYSMKNAPDVYNGDDSSKRDHSQSLYFGSTEPLTGAVELFNQFGQEISTVSLFFKNSETYLLNGDTPDDFQIFKVSDSIGCPSPYSIDSAEVAFDAGDSIKQNVAVWCSSKGPVLFYGNTIIPIWEDIKCYFDPSNDLCVPAAYLYRIAGCVDPQHNCYHLLIPSGSYATTCNVWIVYDFIRRKWYEIDPGVDDPQFIFRVEDNNGAKYLYALTDTGYMLRLNNGRYWSTSSYGITSTVKTSDLLLTDSMWDRTTIRRMKVLLETDTAGYLEVNHYLNGYATATTDSSAATIKLDSAKAISKTGYGYRNLVFSPAYTSSSSQYLISGLTHSFQFDSTLYTTTYTKPRLFGYGIQYQVEREDTIDLG